MIGRIKWLNSFKGYGEIQDSTEKKYYFLLSENKYIKEGALVFFETSYKSSLFNLPKATDLKMISESKEKSLNVKKRRSKNMETTK